MPLDNRKKFSDSAPVWAIPATLREVAADGDGQLLEELIADFQTDTLSRMEVLRRAVAAADSSTVRLEAHTIKGSAMQMGAQRLADSCYRLELAARDAQPQIFMPLYAAVISSFEEVRSAIASTWRPSPPPTR